MRMRIGGCIYGVYTVVTYNGYVCKGIKLDKGVDVQHFNIC